MKENGLKLTNKRNRRYTVQTTADADYANDIVLLADSPAQAKYLLDSLERAAGGIGLHVNADKTEYMCFNQKGNISSLRGGSSETSRQVHLRQKQLLINRDCHQHMTSKGMESYR